MCILERPYTVGSLSAAEDLRIGGSWRLPRALLAGRGLSCFAGGSLPVVRTLAPVGRQADAVVEAGRPADG